MANTVVKEKVQVVALQKARVETCGSKAATCAHLATLTSLPAPEFHSVPGCALTFGSMEAALKLAGLTADHVRLRDRAHTCGEHDLPHVCAELRAVVRQARLPSAAVAEIQSFFAPDAVVVARSSANVEDLAGMSAAGLYESVLGVHVGDAEEVVAGVADVWASLYTERAVRSRRAAGVAAG